LHKPLEKILSRVASIGADSHDSEDVRLQKSLLVICAFPFMFAGIAWGFMYIAFGETIAGLIPLSYSVFSLFSILYFSVSHRFGIFRFSQLLLILLLPCALMTALGGFMNGSAVILWSLICPLGALLFDKPHHAPKWFVAFAVLVILSGVLQPFIAFDNNLSAT
jgi:adenylate cyclase